MPRWAVILLVSAVLIGGGGWLIFGSSLFGVREIAVHGTDVVSRQQVEDAVGLTGNDALAGVDLDALERELKEELPPIESVTITRSFPGTLVVTVTERTAVATVTVDSQPWLIDLSGTPYLALSDYPDEAPKVLPLEVEDPSPQDLATTQAVEVIDGLSDDVRALVAAVSAPSPGEVTLVLQDGRIVIWGDASRMQDKNTMFPAVLEHDGTEYDISSPQAIVIK